MDPAFATRKDGSSSLTDAELIEIAPQFCSNNTNNNERRPKLSDPDGRHSSEIEDGMKCGADTVNTADPMDSTGEGGGVEDGPPVGVSDAVISKWRETLDVSSESGQRPGAFSVEGEGGGPSPSPRVLEPEGYVATTSGTTPGTRSSSYFDGSRGGSAEVSSVPVYNAVAVLVPSEDSLRPAGDASDPEPGVSTSIVNPDIDNNSEAVSKYRRRWLMIIVGSIVMVVAIVVGVAAGVTASGKSSKATNDEAVEFAVKGDNVDGEPGSGHGKAVSLSSDGKCLAVAGDTSVQIFELTNNGTTWMKLGSTLGIQGVNNSGTTTDPKTRVPTTVHLSGNGRFVAIGWSSWIENHEDGSGRTVGRAEVYRFDNNQEKSDWVLQGKPLYGSPGGTFPNNNQTAESYSDWFFGASVSLSEMGDTLAVAASGSGEDCYPSKSGCGSVHVYQYEVGAWEERGSPILGNKIGDIAINSVALSNDGQVVAVGGAADPSLNQGVVCRVYHFGVDLGDWEEVGGGMEGNLGGTSYMVSLSGDGSTVAISNFYTAASSDLSDDTNALLDARVYRITDRTGGWEEVGTNIHANEAGQKSGYYISLSDNGEIIVMGDPGRIGGTGITGHAHIYRYNDTDWEQYGDDLEGEAAGDHFGYVVSISGDGSTFAVGAPFSRAKNTPMGHGRVQVYKLE